MYDERDNMYPTTLFVIWLLSCRARVKIKFVLELFHFRGRSNLALSGKHETKLGITLGSAKRASETRSPFAAGARRRSRGA
eukprot:3130360-Pleurochrysis_carterae.AAC.1